MWSMAATQEVGPTDLLIADDRIEAIGDLPLGTPADEVVDCRSTVILPGLVQPSVELHTRLLRGTLDALEPLDLLRERIWPYEASLDREGTRVAALLAGAELLRGGTTSVLVPGPVRHVEAVFEAVAELGLRATVGKALIDRGHALPAPLRQTVAEALEESETLFDQWHGAENGRIRCAFAPRAVWSSSEALLTGAADRARERGAVLHSRTAISGAEVEKVRDSLSRDTVSYLHQLGLTGPDLVLAHGLYLTSEEQRILRETGAHLVHCPSFGLRLGAGLARIPDLLEMGVSVSLAGGDAGVVDALDGFEEMRLAGLVHAPRYGAAVLPPAKVLELATIAGARALGLESDIGTVEPGKKADLIVVRVDRLHLVAAGGIPATLACSARAADVEHVFVDGVPRVRSGEVIGIDRATLLARARRLAGD